MVACLQGEGQQGQEVVILREAVYRGLGEALMQMEPLMPFQQWWQGELRQLIVACLGVSCFDLKQPRLSSIILCVGGHGLTVSATAMQQSCSPAGVLCS